MLAPMTATLPAELREVFERFITTEYVTIDGRGPADRLAGDALPPPRRRAASTSRPASATRRRPATPRANPQVALLFSDPTGSGLARARRWCSCRASRASTTTTSTPTASATARGRGQAAGRREGPAARAALRPVLPLVLRPHLRPRAARARLRLARAATSPPSPSCYDAHVEEVRSGHDELPDEPPRRARRAARRLGRAHRRARQRAPTRPPSSRSSAPTASRSPCACPVRADRGGRRRAHRARARRRAAGRRACACLTVHDHDEKFTWQRNFQVRGDLVEDERRLGARAAQARRRLRAARRARSRSHARNVDEGQALPQDRQAPKLARSGEAAAHDA